MAELLSVLQPDGNHRRSAYAAIGILHPRGRIRAERGWTQGELAMRLKVSRQTVNAIETERYEPSLSLAFTIAALFERPIEAVFRPRRR